MRPSNKSRSRNKQGNNGGQHNGQRRNTMGNIINRVFESAGPDGKVRGTPQQIIDKYQALARDAQLVGDRVAGESYLQYAEHYSRLLGEAQREQAENQSRFNQNQRSDDRDEGGFDPQQQQQRRPQQQPQPQPVASGLAMIDPEDSDDFSGPIETPENRPRRREDFAQSNGGGERRERYRERADRGEPSAAAEARTGNAPDAAAHVPAPERAPEPVPAPAAEPVTADAPEPAPAPAPETPAPVQAEQAAPPAEDAAPAPAPKRRRRPRAEASAPVVEAE